MGRARKFATNADRQRAYRARKAPRKKPQSIFTNLQEWATAYHEAGHAVIAHLKGAKIDFAEIKGGVAGGRVVHSSLKDEDGTLVLLAGVVAEAIFLESGGMPVPESALLTAGGASDRQKATRALRAINAADVVESANRRAVRTLQVKPDWAKNVPRARGTSDYLKQLRLTMTLEQNLWPAIERVAAALYYSPVRRLDGAEIKRLIGKFKATWL